MLMSATVSDEVEKLNKLILHSPVVLNLLDAGKADGLAAGSGKRARGAGGMLQAPPLKLPPPTVGHLPVPPTLPHCRHCR